MSRFKQMALSYVKVVGRAAQSVVAVVWRLIAAPLRALARQAAVARLIDKVRSKTAPLAHHLNVWRTAWRDEQRQGVVEKPVGRELEFLPAVLEIQDSPPSPLGRTVALTIMAVFLVSIVWATFGKIDIVAVAQGKIIPGDHVKVIQPLESGVVRAIRVREGQAVRKGDLLVELDTTSVAADQERLSNERRSAQVELARLRALLAGKATFTVPAGAEPGFVALQQQMLLDQLQEHRTRTAGARSAIDQRRAAFDGTRANIVKLEATIPLLTQRADGYKKLVEKNLAPRLQFLEIEQQRIEKVQELEEAKHKLTQDAAALVEAEQHLQSLQSEFKKIQLTELSALEIKASSLGQEVIKADQRSQLQLLTASTDGVVQQLAIHTIGGVVTPAQQLMVIVPREHRLEVEAWLENKDIGFVHENQEAEVKIDAFPFTRYGTIDSHVTTLSNDAVPLEKVGLVYAVRLALSRSTMDIDGKRVNLSPGMTVAVEIKTGKRRVIEYFLSPLLKASQESIRER